MKAASIALFVLLTAGQALSSDPAFFESFEGDWQSRWQHSKLKKYAGRFVSFPRPQSKGQDVAIMVSAAVGCGGLAQRRSK